MVYNITKIKYVDKEIYRSGRISPEYLNRFSTVICLENDKEFIEAEEDYCWRHNIKYIRKPLSGFTRPTEEQLMGLLGTITILRRPLLVRCRRGVDRTGFVIAAYRILVNGWDVERAYQECLDNGHRRWIYWWWKKTLSNLT